MQVGWDKKSVKGFSQLLNDTVAIVDNEREFLQACANRFAREAERLTQQGKKKVVRKAYSGNFEYWLAPKDSRQTAFEVVAVNAIGQGPKSRKGTSFTPRGWKLHKLAWLAAGRKSPFRFGADGRTHRTGTKGAQKWASLASRLDKKFGFAASVEIANFAPAIQKMEMGQSGLKAKKIMSPAMSRTSRQILYFFRAINKRIKRQGWK